MKDIDHSTISADDWDEINFPRPEEQEFDRVVERAISRRGFLGGVVAFGSGAAAMNMGLLSATSEALAMGTSRFPFSPIAAQTDFDVHVPEGYNWKVMVRWGDPLVSAADGYDVAEGGPVEKSDMVFGENTDGMETFSYQGRQLIAINSEYTNRKTNLPAAQEGKPANAGDVLKTAEPAGRERDGNRRGRRRLVGCQGQPVQPPYPPTTHRPRSLVRLPATTC